jgi:hypothetical protein
MTGDLKHKNNLFQLVGKTCIIMLAVLSFAFNIQAQRKKPPFQIPTDANAINKAVDRAIDSLVNNNRPKKKPPVQADPSGGTTPEQPAASTNPDQPRVSPTVPNSTDPGRPAAGPTTSGTASPVQHIANPVAPASPSPEPPVASPTKTVEPTPSDVNLGANNSSPNSLAQSPRQIDRNIAPHDPPAPFPIEILVIIALLAALLIAVLVMGMMRHARIERMNSLIISPAHVGIRPLADANPKLEVEGGDLPGSDLHLGIKLNLDPGRQSSSKLSED